MRNYDKKNACVSSLELLHLNLDYKNIKLFSCLEDTLDVLNHLSYPCHLI